MSSGKGLISARKRLTKLGVANADKFMGVQGDARAIAQEFGSAHNGAQPYLRPSLESQSQSTVKLLGEVLARRINQYRMKTR